MSEGMWTDEKVIKHRLAAMQKDIGRHGFYSALWKEGDVWRFVASPDATWLDKRMHEVASPEATVTWAPAYPNTEEA